VSQTKFWTVEETLWIRSARSVTNDTQSPKRRPESNLQVALALDAAWENLGILALAHQSFHPYLSTELPELSALQQQVGEKQAMVDSLRQTKGSNAVRREIEAELAELRERQRRLMIAVGQKAETGTPDIPGPN